jgi:hypothetical protein
MTETGWGSDLKTPPKKKSSLPIWAWACGSGCLFFGAALVLLVWFGAPKVKGLLRDMENPEVQWPALAAVLPLRGERPPYKIEGLPLPFLRMWTLREPNSSLRMHVMAGPQSSNAHFDEWYERPERSPIFGDELRRFRGEPGHIEIQGHDFACTRYSRDPDDEEDAGESTAIEGEETAESPAPARNLVSAIAFEVGGGQDERVLLSFTRRGGGLVDEDVVRFLEPFEVKVRR